MIRSTRTVVTAGLVLGAVLGTSACSNPNDRSASTGPVSGPATTRTLRIGFFGFAKANSFAEATWKGIQVVARRDNATATFVDSNFDAAQQASQLQDAVATKRYDVIILQANDGTAVVQPVRQAIAAGIRVVVDFTPVGGRYDTTAAQVPGTINLVDAPSNSGAGLATMGLAACKQAHASPCRAVYMQGLANYPLDDARTKKAVATLKAGGAQVVATVVGGYSVDTGRSAIQNVLTAHPDINLVVTAGSQAMEGVVPLVRGKPISLVTNGCSTQIVGYIRSGAVYGCYYVPAEAGGQRAAQLGIDAARGKKVPAATDIRSTTPFHSLGTKATLAGINADYTD